MLVEFTVSNFRSIHESQTWSMEAASALKEWGDRNTFPALGGKKAMRLLRAAALYGPNAAGKSTLVQALAFVKGQVVNSARESQQGDLISVVPSRVRHETPQVLDFIRNRFKISTTAGSTGRPVRAF